MGGEATGVIFANNVVVGTGRLQHGPVLGQRSPSDGVPPQQRLRGGAPPFAGCPDPTGKSGNISADPRLVDAAGASPDYRLQPGSPSIDAGLSFAAGFDFDIDGLPRTTDGDGDGTAVVDMGAYEAPTLVPHVSQIPYTVWAQPTAVPLDGIGNWVYPVNEPAATDGQLPPAWFYAHYFGFESGGASAQVGLVTKPDGKFAVFSVFEANGTAHNAVIAFDWTAGRFYFPFVFQVSPGTWGAWVYDDAAGTWTPIGALTLPVGLGQAGPGQHHGRDLAGPHGGGLRHLPPGRCRRLRPVRLRGSRRQRGRRDLERRRCRRVPAGVVGGRAVGSLRRGCRLTGGDRSVERPFAGRPTAVAWSR